MNSKAEFQELKEKLAKLKALQNAPGTPEEAIAAATVISRLLLANNLSMEDIPDIDDIDKQEYEKITVDLETTSASVYKWRVNLLHVIAKAHFCKVIRFTGYKSYYSSTRKIDGSCGIVGQRNNVEVTLALYHYLLKEIQSLTRNAWKVANRYKRDESKWKESFKSGCIITLTERFQAVHKEFDNTDKSHALVIQKEKALNDAYDSFFPDVKKARKTSATLDTGAYLGGKENAKSLKIQHEFNQKRVALNA